MDINLFRQHLIKNQKNISESTDVRMKLGQASKRGQVGWVSIKNKQTMDRALFLPDRNDKAFWSKAQLNKVYRWYRNDDPNNNTTGLIKVDLKRGTFQYIDQSKYEKNDEDLSKDVWSRPLKIDYVTVFDNELLKHQS